jgi:multimeric flavodoxin WrbA
MRIVAFNGSPRGAQGNTHLMVTEFLAGAAEAGADTENVLLAEKHIEHCSGCFTCWTRTPGECRIQDDAGELLEKFTAADVVVFATPVHTDNVTGLLKTFIDRAVPLLDPHFEKDESGETRHPLRHGKSPKFVVVSNCGYPEQTHFQVIRLFFERVARNAHSEVVAEIYRGGGELLRTGIPALEPLVQQYEALLRKAGREVATDLELSDETRSELERPLVSYDTYITEANRRWDEVLRRLATGGESD